MSHFLWIEDFENSPKVSADGIFHNLFSELDFKDNRHELKKQLKDHGVFVELNFQDGLLFIRKQLTDIDYIILDIDLIAYGEGDELTSDVRILLQKWHDYQQQEDEENDEISLQKALNALKMIAGYYLYLELLMRLGFPEKRIIFCSNHGENLKSIQIAFHNARIEHPTIYQKSDPFVGQWIKDNHDNAYSKLRRGIIEACRYLRTLPDSAFILNISIGDAKKQFSNEDWHNYLEVLENSLPLLAPEKNANIYKLFIRTLAHEWEALGHNNTNHGKSEINAFSTIMKWTRNWMAHDTTLNALTEQDVAFLVICAMRAMFDLGADVLPYEKILFDLFKEPLGAKEINKKIGNSADERRIPLEKTYDDIFHRLQIEKKPEDFKDILKELHIKKVDHEVDDVFFIKGLYQMFWLLTSSRRGNKRPFNYFDYKQTPFLLELSRRIYRRSFE